ncbi:MAG: NADH:flavin oxidoreductase [Salinisphaeraceae bacterium]|nr:NADH:flavin oxidoreductase [Salinisphaeraceae bacterium]
MKAFEPVQIGPLKLKNRIIKSATNEGMAPGGVPSKMLVEYHRRVAAGGAALSTVAYCAVTPDGRTFPDQVCLDEQTVPHLKVLTDAVHAEGGKACAQITHGGSFNFLPKLTTRYPLSASGGFNPVGLMVWRPFKQGMSPADLQRMANDFAKAALKAEQAGFDAVEIHMGHGYLLSQFISPLYNKRRDQYGGDARGRAQFPAMVLRRVLDAVGDRLAVICKISVIEGVKKGAGVDHSIEVAKVLEEAGAHMLVLSAGMNVESPWQIFGSQLPASVADTVKNPVMRWGARLTRLFEPKVEFKPLYLREHSMKVRQAVQLPLTYLGGSKHLADIQQVCADGFDCVAMGRALLHEPDIINQYQQGSATESGCISCNECVPTIYHPGGTHCPLVGENPPELNQQAATN